MIELSIAGAFMLYLGLMLSALLAVWMWSSWKRSRRTVVPSRTQLLRCEYCHHVYVEDVLRPVTECPECKSFNKGNRF